MDENKGTKILKNGEIKGFVGKIDELYQNQIKKLIFSLLFD